jgi:hypothetical protein
VDPSPADVRRPKAFGHVIAARRLDIVHHQVEGRCGTGRRRPFRFPDDDMRAAAKLEDGEAVVGEYRRKPTDWSQRSAEATSVAGSQTCPTATGGL